MAARACVDQQAEPLRRGLRTGKRRDRPWIAEGFAGGVLQNQLIRMFGLEPRQVERVELADRVEAHACRLPRAGPKRRRRGDRAFETGLQQKAVVADAGKQMADRAGVPVFLLGTAGDGECSRTGERGREKFPSGNGSRHVSWLVSNCRPPIRPGWRAPPCSRRDRAARVPNDLDRRCRREDCDGEA